MPVRYGLLLNILHFIDAFFFRNLMKAPRQQLPESLQIPKILDSAYGARKMYITNLSLKQMIVSLIQCIFLLFLWYICHFNNRGYMWWFFGWFIVNRLICCRVEPTAQAARLGESPPGQDRNYPTWLCGLPQFQSTTLRARGAAADLPRSHSYTNPTQGGLRSVNHRTPTLPAIIPDPLPSAQGKVRYERIQGIHHTQQYASPEATHKPNLYPFTPPSLSSCPFAPFMSCLQISCPGRIIIDMLTHLCLLLLIASSFSAQDFTKLNDLMRDLINQRAFPGGSVIIANQTAIIYRKNYGYLSYSYQMHDVEVTDSTKYDLASLTKVMATTFNIMNLASSSSIKLDDLVTKYVPNYDTNKKTNTTIANLMLHNAGLSYDYPGPLPRTTDQVISYITFAKPDFPVGTKFQYSNLGFLLLSEIVAKVAKKPFDKYFEQNKVFAGLKSVGFNPSQTEWYNIAPTEYDSETRKRIVRGEAHERLAYFFGGVAGHSGLFSNADDIIRFMRILLCKGKLPNEPTRVISQALATQYTTRVTGLSYNNTRSYGFDTNCPGSKMSNCFGHDGSTGIMAWADKDKKIAFAVLTNRGHPDVKNGLFDSHKPQIVDAIMQGLGY